MSKLTRGTLVRLSRKGKDSWDLQGIPRDSVGIVLKHVVVVNHLGHPIPNIKETYRIKWSNAYYPHYDCYRHEVVFADKEQMRMNKERIAKEIYATKY